MAPTVNQQKIDSGIDSINNFLRSGWRDQHYELDVLISRMTAREMHYIWSDDRTNADLATYISSFHVTWLFEIVWAERAVDPEGYAARCKKEGAEIEGLPKAYDPDVPLGSLFLWAPQDQMSRIAR